MNSQFLENRFSAQEPRERCDVRIALLPRPFHDNRATRTGVHGYNCTPVLSWAHVWDEVRLVIFDNRRRSEARGVACLGRSYSTTRPLQPPPFTVPPLPDHPFPKSSSSVRIGKRPVRCSRRLILRAMLSGGTKAAASSDLRRDDLVTKFHHVARPEGEKGTDICT
jgi:hypothetical protein